MSEAVKFDVFFGDKHFDLRRLECPMRIVKLFMIRVMLHVGSRGCKEAVLS